MAKMEFGTTWWGRAWLNALHEMDFSKRLPQGEPFAREGYVSSIEIERNIIKAKVDDPCRMTPYLVSMEFPVFSDYNIETISESVESNHYYIAKLESKTLPPALSDELKNKHISLFPRSFREISMDCSCDDFAFPCRHVSSVIYIIANEIDKNPFLIFELRGFNILNIIKPEEINIDGKKKIPVMDSFLMYKSREPEQLKSDKLEVGSIDFSKIPDLRDTINKLLTPKPLFVSSGDFKKHLMKQYDQMQYKMNKFIKLAEIYEKPDTKYSSISIKIKNTSLDFVGKVWGQKDNIEFYLETMDEFVEYLQSHPAEYIAKYSVNVAFIAQIYSFVLKLIQQCAYIPDLFAISEDEYMIRWIPAIFEKKTNAIFESLCRMLPSDIIHYGKSQIDRKQQVFFLISFFISYFHKKFDVQPKRGDVDIYSLFFNFDVYTQIKFEDKQIAETIYLWLSRFYITTKNCTPVIKIDESTRHGDRFLFQIMVHDKAKEMSDPMPFKLFVASDHPEKNDILKDMALLSTYLPQVNDFLKLKANEKRLTIFSEEFVSVWFDALPILDTLGIKTILPNSLTKVIKPTVSLNFEAGSNFNSSKTSYLNLNSMLEFKWNIAIGDKFLNKDEFKKLVSKYSGILKIKDSYVFLDPKQTGKILQQLEKPIKLTKSEILRINLEKKYNGSMIQTDKSTEKLFKTMFKKYDPEIPSNLNATLRPYQKSGYKWLYNNFMSGIGSLMADDMGLGKTIQVITLLLKLKQEKILDKKKAIIIVPATLLTNWEHEIRRFAPDLKTLVYHGKGRKLELQDIDIAITTYSIIRNESEMFSDKKWLCVISDETQNIKNPASSQTKALKLLKGDAKIAMTGTPVENRLMDYWSIIDFTMKNLLGKRAVFKENFALPIERFRNQAKLDDFRNVTAPFILRRIKTDKSIIDDLPEKFEIEEYNSLTKEQAALYQQVIENLELDMQSSEGIERKGLIFKLIVSLKQICNHPTQYLKGDNPKITQSGKTMLLVDMLEKIFDVNEKAIVFTQYKQMGDLLQIMLEEQFGFLPLFLHGSLTRNKRDSIIRQFQIDRDTKMMILSLKAGGTGLNLTAANNVIHYDLWWNPAVENQATDRAFRIGQKKDVNVFRMITQGTFEEKINALLRDKIELADLTVNVGEKWISEMSDSDLKKLVKLGDG